MLTNDEWNELSLRVNLAILNSHKVIRLGQAWYNALSDMRKDLAEKIVGTDKDPFYDDNNLDRFFKFLSKEEEDE